MSSIDLALADVVDELVGSVVVEPVDELCQPTSRATTASCLARVEGTRQSGIQTTPGRSIGYTVIEIVALVDQSRTRMLMVANSVPESHPGDSRSRPSRLATRRKGRLLQMKVSSSFGRSPPPGYEGDAELVQAGKAREMLSPFVLSSSDLREATQRTLHARGYPAIRVGPLNGRALVVEHPSEEGARLDLLIRSLDPSAHRLQPRAPEIPKASPPVPRAAEAARWRSVWW